MGFIFVEIIVEFSLFVDFCLKLFRPLYFKSVAGENIVTNNNLGKNNLSITPYTITPW